MATFIHGGWNRFVGSLRSSLYVSSFHLIAANIVNAAFGFLFWASAARLYRPPEVGLAAAVVSALGLLALVSTLGLDYAMIRFLPHATDRQGIINSSLTIGTGAALGLSLVFLGGVGVWSPAFLPSRASPVFVTLLVAGTVLTTVMGLLNSVFLARKQANFVWEQSSVFGATKVVFAVGLAVVGRPIGLVVPWTLGLIAAVGCGLAMFLPRVEHGSHRLRAAVSWKALNDMTHFAFTNYMSTVLWNAPAYLLPLLVANVAGREANAYFYVAFNVGGLVSMIPASVALSLFAHGSHEESELIQRAFASLKFSLGVLLPVVGGVFLLGGKILLLFGAAYSLQSTALLWVLALSAIPITVNSLYFSVRRVQNRMNQVLMCMGWILGVTLSLSIVLLPRMGITAAGVAWLVAHGSVAMLIMALYLVQRI